MLKRFLGSFLKYAKKQAAQKAAETARVAAAETARVAAAEQLG